MYVEAITYTLAFNPPQYKIKSASPANPKRLPGSKSLCVKREARHIRYRSNYFVGLGLFPTNIDEIATKGQPLACKSGKKETPTVDSCAYTPNDQERARTDVGMCMSGCKTPTILDQPEFDGQENDLIGKLRALKVFLSCTPYTAVKLIPR